MMDWADENAASIDRFGMSDEAQKMVAIALRDARNRGLDEAAKIADAEAKEAGIMARESCTFTDEASYLGQESAAEEIASLIRALKDKQP